MANKTFKQIDKKNPILKTIKKAGLSLAIVFSKEELERFNISYGDKILLDNAEIIKAEYEIVKVE